MVRPYQSKDHNNYKANDEASDGKKHKQKKYNDVNEKHERKPREDFIQKYHENNLLAEAVIVSGKAYFAVASSSKLGNQKELSITLKNSIPLDENTILKPPELMAYMNKPYVFKSKEEFDKFGVDTRIKNLDTIYRKVKSIWKKYIDADDFHLSICAADTLFTYFQDKIGLTHYLFFEGGNNSGKSNNLTVLHFLAYRNMTSSDITSANIYQFLGSREEAIGTICEDEADDIDEDKDKMRIYKNGYTTGHPILRTDTSFGRKQYKFNTFCFKAFASEMLPDSIKAKGFNQRIVELQCTYGFPKYDISEVVNPAGEDEYQQLLDELLETRNMLLIYRLLHFEDKIPDIKLNIENREKQLFKPVLRIFQNTQTLNELLPVISKYISQKRENNANSLHAFLYRTIRDLIKAQNTTELSSNLIWETINDLLSGSVIPNKPLSYESSEFGTLSQKSITETLIQVFGAKQSPNRKDKRKLIFNLTKLDRLTRVYDLEIQIRVETTGGSSTVTDPTDVTDVGLDKHIREQSAAKESDSYDEKKANIDNENIENNVIITPQEHNKDLLSSAVPSQTSHPSPNTIDVLEPSLTTRLPQDAVIKYQDDILVENKSSFSIYRLGHSDNFACQNCKVRGDKWFMRRHHCKGLSKVKSE